jgi:small subunit ribosomal protein S17e
MGRIKTSMVKRAAKQLLADEETKAKFSEDFDHNKRLIIDIMPSKPIRNKVAGYISRLIRESNKSKAI